MFRLWAWSFSWRSGEQAGGGETIFIHQEALRQQTVVLGLGTNSQEARGQAPAGIVSLLVVVMRQLRTTHVDRLVLFAFLAGYLGANGIILRRHHHQFLVDLRLILAPYRPFAGIEVRLEGKAVWHLAALIIPP